MRIIKSLPSDHFLLSEITKLSKAHWGYSADQILAWDEDLTVSEAYISNNEVYKLEIDNKIIGYYSYWLTSNSEAYLDNLFLHPDYIGKGLGVFLMKDCFERLQQEQISIIKLEADPNVFTFYEKLGFVIISNKESSIKGRFLPIMQKNLQ